MEKFINESVCPVLEFQSDQKHNIGVIITRINPNQLHCGVTYKLEKEFHALHLAWHYKFEHGVNIDDFQHYLVVKTKIPPIRQTIVSSRWQRIWNLNQKKSIPYGLYYEKSFFDDNGRLLLGNDESGLTCGTFVLAIFKYCGYDLIDIANWKQREDDSIFHQYIIDTFEERKDIDNIEEGHIEKVRKEKGCFRFKPEEVAAGATFKEAPGTFEDITILGSIISKLV